MNSNEPTDLKDLEQEELTTASSSKKDAIDNVTQKESSEHWERKRM